MDTNGCAWFVPLLGNCHIFLLSWSRYENRATTSSPLRHLTHEHSRINRYAFSPLRTGRAYKAASDRVCHHRAVRNPLVAFSECVSVAAGSMSSHFYWCGVGTRWVK